MGVKKRRLQAQVTPISVFPLKGEEAQHPDN